MALTRKFLVAMGVEDEKIDEIIKAHTETVNALKEERDSYKENAEKYAEAQKELSELRKVAEANADNPYEEKYKALKKEYEAYKTEITTKETQAKKLSAYKRLLKEAGVSEKRIESIAKVSGEAISSLEFDDDGKVKSADEIKKSIEAEWADFIVKEGVQGATVVTPPDNNGNGDVKTTGRAAQLAAKYHENLYGKTKEE